MTDCDKYIELISSLADGELSAEQEAELRAHIDVCPDCRRVYNAFTAISKALTDLEETPQGFADSVMYRIEKQRKGSRPHFFAFGRFTAIAACLVLILFGASRLGLFQPKGQSSGDMAVRSTYDAENGAVTYDDTDTSPDESSETSTTGTAKDSNMQFSDGITCDESIMHAGGLTASGPACSAMHEELSKKLLAGEVAIFAGEKEDANKLATVDGEVEADSLLAILDCSCIDETRTFTEKPDYTLVFSDGDCLLVWRGESEVFCRLEDGSVYLACGSPQELADYISSVLEK